MQDNGLPSPLCGQWIWKKSLSSKSDTFMMFRRAFQVDTSIRNAGLWISANSAYELFINNQLVGFGPRAHHNPESSYVDRYDLSYHLQSGPNVVGVIVYHNIDHSGVVYDYRVPGLWCQIEVDHRIRIGTDALWQMKEGSCFEAPRPRSRSGQVLTESFQAIGFDDNWADPSFQNMPPWEKPDQIIPVGEYGTLLEPQPFPPPMVDSSVSFDESERGRLEHIPAHTLVGFTDVYRHGEWSYAAESFVFSEEARVVRCGFHADDPLRVFADGRLVCDAGADFRSSDLEGFLTLNPGWTRILVVMTPSRFSMGLLLTFPDGELSNADFRSAPEATASAEWRLSGALRLPLSEATSSLHLPDPPEGEDIPTFRLSDRSETDVSDLLRGAHFLPSDAVRAAALSAGEYVLYQLDAQRYGFPAVELEAEEGDVVDITIGLRRNAGGCPVRGNSFRATHTIHCRKGFNRYVFFSPRECFYLMVTPRRTGKTVSVGQVEFLELHRLMRHETQFHCSDDGINAMWEAGRNMTARAATIVPLAEPMARQDIFLFDSFMHAINMSAVYGDNKFSEGLLSELLSEQFENGNIPVLTCSKRQVSQLQHLFILPVWIDYNYKLSGDEGVLQSRLPQLDLACEFFTSLADAETGLLVEPDETIPTRLNALYCRFLLSAAELYRVAGRTEEEHDCMARAANTAKHLRFFNTDPESGLLASSSCDGVRSETIDFENNFAAFYGGVLPMGRFDRFFDRFFLSEAPFVREGTRISPYDYFLFCEMLFAMRRHDWALGFLLDYWGRRYNAETVSWTRFPDSKDPAMVRFHDGILVLPNVFFVREIAGVRAAAEAHSKIYFAPALQLVDFAEITLPVVYGRIKLRWEKHPDGLIDVAIDANYPLQVIPEMTAEELKKTEFALGDNVTLMSPAE